jgi:hypothetical protein
VQEVHLELLVGRRVVDAEGRRLGRIEEVRAEQGDDGYVVREYLLGPSAAAERLSAWAVTLPLLRFLRKRVRFGFYRVRWDELDLSEPGRPRTLRPREALERIDITEARGLDDGQQAQHGSAQQQKQKGGKTRKKEGEEGG